VAARRPPPPAPPSSRRVYLFVAAALAIAAIAAVFYAANTNPSRLRPKVDTANLPEGPVAPAVNANGWINSPPLPPAGLTGKVVLYDFWTYSCVNCVRTIPYLQSWYNRYRTDGLVIIGIHTPEFDFEHDRANVTRAVVTLGVTWPVALDNSMSVWDAFGNNSWPADYVADRSGHLRYSSVGEGGYQQTEDVIRTLLNVPATSPRAAPPSKPDTDATSTADITPETYLGVERGTEAQQGPATYPDPGASVPVDSAKLSGPWTATAQYVEANSATSAIVLHYQAREVDLVLAPPASGPVDVVVELDGKPLPPAYRTGETVVSPDGQTTVKVTDADMFKLVLGPAVEGHTLRITTTAPGLLAYDFTFGS
jgi:thiol-disulfide isomerase/thioredoxin